MTPEMGTCCICGGTSNVNNVFMLNKLCPTPGHGWGCVQCDLAGDGALAVVCEPCYHEHAEKVMDALEWACTGYPATEGRTPIGELTGNHEHDLTKHPEVTGYHFGEEN